LLYFDHKSKEVDMKRSFFGIALIIIITLGQWMTSPYAFSVGGAGGNGSVSISVTTTSTPSATGLPITKSASTAITTSTSTLPLSPLSPIAAAKQPADSTAMTATTSGESMATLAAPLVAFGRVTAQIKMNPAEGTCSGDSTSSYSQLSAWLPQMQTMEDLAIISLSFGLESICNLPVLSNTTAATTVKSFAASKCAAAFVRTFPGMLTGPAAFYIGAKKSLVEMQEEYEKIKDIVLVENRESIESAFKKMQEDIVQGTIQFEKGGPTSYVHLQYMDKISNLIFGLAVVLKTAHNARPLAKVDPGYSNVVMLPEGAEPKKIDGPTLLLQKQGDGMAAFWLKNNEIQKKFLEKEAATKISAFFSADNTTVADSESIEKITLISGFTNMDSELAKFKNEMEYDKDTREFMSIIAKEIKNMSNNEESRPGHFYIHGPAGSGKTALMDKLEEISMHSGLKVCKIEVVEIKNNFSKAVDRCLMSAKSKNVIILIDEMGDLFKNSNSNPIQFPNPLGSYIQQDPVSSLKTIMDGGKRVIIESQTLSEMLNEKTNGFSKQDAKMYHNLSKVMFIGTGNYDLPSRNTMDGAALRQRITSFKTPKVPLETRVKIAKKILQAATSNTLTVADIEKINEITQHDNKRTDGARVLIRIMNAWALARKKAVQSNTTEKTVDHTKFYEDEKNDEPAGDMNSDMNPMMHGMGMQQMTGK